LQIRRVNGVWLRYNLSKRNNVLLYCLVSVPSMSPKPLHIYLREAALLIGWLSRCWSINSTFLCHQFVRSQLPIILHNLTCLLRKIVYKPKNTMSQVELLGSISIFILSDNVKILWDRIIWYCVTVFKILSDCTVILSFCITFVLLGNIICTGLYLQIL
jgi:hypothetical protein